MEGGGGDNERGIRGGWDTEGVNRGKEELPAVAARQGRLVARRQREITQKGKRTSTSIASWVRTLRVAAGAPRRPAAARNYTVAAH